MLEWIENIGSWRVVYVVDRGSNQKLQNGVS
jgi:hypothetical protein